MLVYMSMILSWQLSMFSQTDASRYEVPLHQCFTSVRVGVVEVAESVANGYYYRRGGRNQWSSKDEKSSSTNWSKTDDRVKVTPILGAPNEDRRGLSSGSANGRETIASRTTTGRARASRSCRSYLRRRSGSASVSYAC